MQTITPAQLAMIRNYFIELGMARNVPELFMKWWDKQDHAEMRAKAEKLSKYDASCIISESVSGNYSRAQELWEMFTNKK
jgi:hypothetical protein